MRVLLVNSFYYPRGGDCVHVLMLERVLRDAGHEIAVLAMNHPDNLSSPWQGYWVDRVEYSGRPGLAEQAALLPRSLYHPPAASAMKRLIEAFQPDIVHLHSIEHHLTLACLVGARDRDVPVVWTLHDYRLVCPATDMLRQGIPCERCEAGAFWHCITGRCKQGSTAKSIAAALESYAARASSLLAGVESYVAPSRFLARTVLRMGLPTSRVVVVPNPVAFGGPDAAHIRKKSAPILYVGRLSREKGVAHLVEAVRGVEGAHLVVAGDGPDRAGLEDRARASGGHVTFLGWQTTDEVTRLMSQAAALAVPSTWYENCPLVVLEAMMVGLPVVASEIGGLTELLGAGRFGYLVAPADSNAWGATLRHVLDHPEEAAHRAANARQRVATRHSSEAFLELILRVYDGAHGVRRSDSAQRRSV